MLPFAPDICCVADLNCVHVILAVRLEKVSDAKTMSMLHCAPDRCKELAKPAGLAAVCDITGVRQAGEQLELGIPVNLEATLIRIVDELCSLTGMPTGAGPGRKHLLAGLVFAGVGVIFMVCCKLHN